MSVRIVNPIVNNLKVVDCCGNCKHFVDIETYPTLCGKYHNPYAYENEEEFKSEAWNKWYDEYFRQCNELAVKAFNICDLHERKPDEQVRDNTL